MRKNNECEDFCFTEQDFSFSSLPAMNSVLIGPHHFLSSVRVQLFQQLDPVKAKCSFLHCQTIRNYLNAPNHRLVVSTVSPHILKSYSVFFSANGFK